MPQLKEYTASVDKLQPTDRGTDAYAAAGRRIGGFYNQAADAIKGGARAEADAAGDVAKSFSGVATDVTDALKQQEDYAGHRAIAKGAPASMQMLAGLSDKWDATVKNADPNDPSVAAKFRESVMEPALENFKDAYSGTDLGSKWAEQTVDQMRKHLFEKTAADMSTLAGDAVAVNVKQLGNSISNSARSSPDLHNVDFLLNKTDGDVDAIISSSPNLKGTAAAKARMQLTEQIKEQTVKAGALGAMEKAADPEAVADTFAKRYPQYINGQEIDQFAKMARYYKRVGESEDRAQRVQADYVAKKDFNDKINKLEMSTTPKSVGDPPTLPKDYWDTLRDLSSHPGASLEPGRLASMETKGNAITAALNKPEPLGRVSHDTTMTLLKQMRASDDTRLTDNTAIYEAYGNGKLSRADFNFLNNEFTQMKTPQGEALGRDRTEFFKKYAGAVDGAMDYGGHSALGSQRMYAFEMDARRQEEDLRKQGKDPHQLYDPSSPNFIGNQVPKYQTTLTESMQWNKEISEQKKKGAAPANTNLTGPGKDVISTQVTDIPKGMTAAEAMKRFKSGTQIRLPDGRIGTVP